MRFFICLFNTLFFAINIFIIRYEVVIPLLPVAFELIFVKE